MSALYLNTFHPLVGTPFGREASSTHNLPPFIDCSIRREPDFEHPHPVITCICRAGKFAPRLVPGDVVVYLTVKRRFGLPGPPHRRFIAVLEAKRTFDSHREAAQWFIERDMPLPTNLLVRGNPPKPLDRSDGRTNRRAATPAKLLREWNRLYWDRVAVNGRVVGCELKYVNLDWSAPIVTDRDLKAVFGYVPATRNPGKHDLNLLPRLLKRFAARATSASAPKNVRSSNCATTCSPQAKRAGCPSRPSPPSVTCRTRSR